MILKTNERKPVSSLTMNVLQMVDRMFVEDEAYTLNKDIFESLHLKQAYLLLITLVTNKEDH
jgi:hypothetical protein